MPRRRRRYTQTPQTLIAEINIMFNEKKNRCIRLYIKKKNINLLFSSKIQLNSSSHNEIWTQFFFFVNKGTDFVLRFQNCQYL